MKEGLNAQEIIEDVGLFRSLLSAGAFALLSEAERLEVVAKLDKKGYVEDKIINIPPLISVILSRDPIR